MRIIYISGRYRHYNPDGSFDEARMSLECDSEAWWATLVAKLGHAWIAPLHNSVCVEHRCPHIPPDQYISGDLEIIRRLRPGHDALLFRPGWRRLIPSSQRPAWYPGGRLPPSQGCYLERRAAMKQGLIIIDPSTSADADLVDGHGCGTDIDEIANALYEPPSSRIIVETPSPLEGAYGPIIARTATEDRSSYGPPDF